MAEKITKNIRNFVDELLQSSAGCARIDELREFADKIKAGIPDQEQINDPELEQLFRENPDLREEYYYPDKQTFERDY